jgi:hypothetical protein
MLVPALLVTGLGLLVWRATRERPRLLDVHLPPETENAVVWAASHEQNPLALRSFANSLLPDFPSAASVLMARANLHETVAPSVSPHAAGDVAGGFNLFHAIKTAAQDATKVGPLAFIPGAGAAVVLASGVAAAGHTRGGKRIGTDLAKNKILNAVTKGYTGGYMQANPAYFARTLVASASDEVLHGKRLDKAILDQRHAVSSWLTDKASYASQAAGVPPVVTPALTAAANIAAGKPIPSNIVNVAAGVVGSAVGPEASDALQQGAAYGDKLTGGATTQALAAVAQARNAVPPHVQHAFDSGVALSVGQHLQSKGFTGAEDLLKNVHPASQVVGALNASTDDLLTTAIKSLQQRLPAGSADVAQRAAAEVVANPALARASSEDLARQLGITEPIARVVLASLTNTSAGPVVHAQRLAAVVGRPSPPTGHVAPQQSRWVDLYGAQAGY